MNSIFSPSRYKYSFIILRQLVITDFKLRYQGSLLGYFWSLLKPLAQFGILYVVFSVFLRVGKDIDNFPLYLLLGIVLWSFFLEVTINCMMSVVIRGGLISKINFPRYVIVLSSAFSGLINLFFNMIVVLIFALVTGAEFGIQSLLIFPLIIELFTFTLAVGFILSTLYITFRDINFIWEVIMQGAFYATPILYPLSLVPEKIAKAMMLNPMAQIIQDMRYALVSTNTQTIGDLYGHRLIWLVPLGLSVILISVSSILFRHRSKYFAESV